VIWLTSQLCDKESKSNTDWSDECSSMFLSSQHEDCKDKLSRQDHLNDETLCNRCILVESRSNVQVAWNAEGDLYL
jgi:hypothetical protein